MQVTLPTKVGVISESAQAVERVNMIERAYGHSGMLIYTIAIPNVGCVETPRNMIQEKRQASRQDELSPLPPRPPRKKKGGEESKKRGGSG